MIKVDISNVWGQLSLPDLLAVEHEVAAAHNTLANGTGAGNNFSFAGDLLHRSTAFSQKVCPELGKLSGKRKRKVADIPFTSSGKCDKLYSNNPEEGFHDPDHSRYA